MTRAALLLCAYTAQRPGVVAAMCWGEVVLEAGEWRIPAAKMKMCHAHIVPLPRQAVALLRDMAVYTAGREYVFPPLARQKTPYLHRDSLSRALRSLGLEDKHATHGFRAMLRPPAESFVRKPRFTRSSISRRAVSCEHLVKAAHLDNVSLPS